MANRDNQLHESIARAEYVTLEIGTGRDPLFGLSEQSFDTSSLYIGLNIDPAQHSWLQWAVGDNKGMIALQAARNIYGRMTQTPIPSGSIDMVHISNVFGEPDSPHIMYDFQDKNHVYHGNSSEAAKIATLLEVKRVLRSSGEIVIIEDNTPYGNVSETPKSAKLVRILEEKGFQIVLATDTQSAFKCASEEYRPERYDSYSSMFSYVIRARKP